LIDCLLGCLFLNDQLHHHQTQTPKKGSLSAILMLATGGKSLGIEIDQQRHDRAVARWLPPPSLTLSERARLAFVHGDACAALDGDGGNGDGGDGDSGGGSGGGTGGSNSRGNLSDGINLSLASVSSMITVALVVQLPSEELLSRCLAAITSLHLNRRATSKRSSSSSSSMSNTTATSSSSVFPGLRHVILAQKPRRPTRNPVSHPPTTTTPLPSSADIFFASFRLSRVLHLPTSWHPALPFYVYVPVDTHGLE
jgi:hypothetical protein